MVNQLECKEPGCPPVECVIALLRKPKLMFKVRPPNPQAPATARSLLSRRSRPVHACVPPQIFKAMADVTEEEAVGALKKALADEKSGTEHGHHEHGHCSEHAHGSEHDHKDGHGDCCEHGHDDGEGHEHGHGHEHKEHEHGHS